MKIQTLSFLIVVLATISNCKFCQDYQQYDTKTKTCKFKCLYGQVWENIQKNCICKSGTYLVGASCQICFNGWVYNQAAKKCQQMCNKAHEYYQAGKCECYSGYYRLNQQCVSNKCPENSYFSQYSKSCVCENNFILNLNTFQCEPAPNCPSKSHLTNNICQCQDGYHMNSDKTECQKCKDQKYEVFNGIQCVCQSGYVKNINQQCVKIIIPVCKRDQVFNLQNKRCECKPGSERIGGECIASIKCKVNQYWNGKQCACQSGYYKSSVSLFCQILTVQIPKCSPHSTFNGQKCICDQNYFEYEPGKCATCAPGMSWNGQKCSYNKSCWQGYVWNQQKSCCIPSGHECPENSKWNGQQCQCEQNYYNINNKCTKCQEGFRFDGSGCSAIQSKDTQCSGVNRILISGKCVCKPNTNQYNGVCIQCSYPSVWNGKFCEGIKDACYNLPNSVIDPATRRCKCKNGYRAIGGSCVALPGYVTINGVVYNQKDGYRWAGPDGTNAKVLFSDQYKNKYPYNAIKSEDQHKNKDDKKNGDKTDQQWSTDKNIDKNHNNNDAQNDQDSNQYQNQINGKDNTVDGTNNYIDGNNNLVEGNGNVIVDQSSTSDITNIKVDANTQVSTNIDQKSDSNTNSNSNVVNGQNNVVNGENNQVNGNNNVVDGNGYIIWNDNTNTNTDVNTNVNSNTVNGLDKKVDGQVTGDSTIIIGNGNIIG